MRGKIALLTFVVFAAIARAQSCDESLWKHVYAGDLRRFSAPEDRLKVLDRCKVVTGVILSAVKEPDGDWHIRLKLDHGYESLLNAKNKTAQKGALVLEPVCENAVSQADTLKSGACRSFAGHVYDKSLKGKHVRVIGAYVEDQEHGWREIHPVTEIRVIP